MSAAEAWSAFQRELDRWKKAGRRADFWWRDDDVVEPTAALERLLKLAHPRRGAARPLALAVIPAKAKVGLARRLLGATHILMLQHGYAHKSHAAPGAKTIELGGLRSTEVIASELARGWRRGRQLFGAKLAPVMVPPWNRIEPEVIRQLPALGYRALSTFAPRQRGRSAPGLLQVNVHIEIMNWQTRRFLGEAEALGYATRHLRAKRLGRADAGEPTGLMTHHLAHDPAAWRFLATFLAAIDAHPAAHWLAPERVFGLGRKS